MGSYKVMQKVTRDQIRAALVEYIAAGKSWPENVEKAPVRLAKVGGKAIEASPYVDLFNNDYLGMEIEE